MRSRHVFHAVDSHSEGMPTRVITGGVGVIPGATMAERRTYFLEHLDHLSTLLRYEPRGHAAMSGAILQPPTRPDADYGVLTIEVSGCCRCAGTARSAWPPCWSDGMVGDDAGDGPARRAGRPGRGRRGGA
jgi:proline racemase